MIFTINSQIRGGKNHIKIDPRSGRRYPEKKWAKWRDTIVDDLGFYLKSLGWRPIDYTVSILIEYYPGDKRVRDVPAILDVLFHCFERSGLVTDDKFFTDVYFKTCEMDRKNPRVEVDVT